MKIAYLINAHKNFDQLERLVSRLNHDAVDFFIHIDKKVDAASLSRLVDSLKKYSPTLIPKRVDVSWGGFSQIEATVNGLHSIIASGNSYDYICFLSGQDYPIQSNEKILGFLSNHKGCEFIDCYEVSPASHAEALVRFERYSLFEEISNPLLRLYLERALRVLLPKRRLPKGYRTFGGSSWWTISFDCAKYLIKFIDEQRSFFNFFRYALCPDETFFQTLIMNSPYNTKVYNDNLRHIDWPAGQVNPRILTSNDLARILSSMKLFARKFDVSSDEEILNLIDHHITTS